MDRFVNPHSNQRQDNAIRSTYVLYQKTTTDLYEPSDYVDSSKIDSICLTELSAIKFKKMK